MTLILGKSQATAQQMATYLLSKNPKPKFSRNITALEFCQIFLDECAKEGVRGDGAFAQSCKETGYFAYGGDVKYTQNNFAGIGATGGVPGCSFSSIEVGVLAQAQHLKTYATKEPLNCANVDPRRTTWFVNTKGGTAKTFEELGGSWACPGYNTKKYKSLEDANKAKDSYGYQIVDILDDILKIKTKEEGGINKMGYNLKINYADKSNYGSYRATSKIKYIVWHYTANDGDTDEANAKYFKRANLKSSAHYFVDDDSITISVPDTYVAWSVGGSRYSNYKTTGGAKYYKICTNSNSLSIELCDTVKDGSYNVSEKTLNNAIELTRDLMKKYNIPIENVIRHFDVTGKSCPAYYVNNTKWNMVKARIAPTSTSTPMTSSPTATSLRVPLKITQSKKSIQEFLNNYYGNEIKNVTGSLLAVDGAIGKNSKLALAIAFQVELNKLGAGLVVDGKFGSSSAASFDKYVGKLVKGSKSIFVTLWQCVLVGHDVNPNGIDGSFGNGCVTATNTLFPKFGLGKDSSVSGSDINKIL